MGHRIVQKYKHGIKIQSMSGAPFLPAANSLVSGLVHIQIDKITTPIRQLLCTTLRIITEYHSAHNKL